MLLRLFKNVSCIFREFDTGVASKVKSPHKSQLSVDENLFLGVWFFNICSVVVHVELGLKCKVMKYNLQVDLIVWLFILFFSLLAVKSQNKWYLVRWAKEKSFLSRCICL